jgi:hypothetical protein
VGTVVRGRRGRPASFLPLRPHPCTLPTHPHGQGMWESGRSGWGTRWCRGTCSWRLRRTRRRWTLSARRRASSPASLWRGEARTFPSTRSSASWPRARGTWPSLLISSWALRMLRMLLRRRRRLLLRRRRPATRLLLPSLLLPLPLLPLPRVGKGRMDEESGFSRCMPCLEGVTGKGRWWLTQQPPPPPPSRWRPHPGQPPGQELGLPKGRSPGPHPGHGPQRPDNQGGRAGVQV